MRPCCSYFDKQDKKKHDKNKTDDPEEGEKESEPQQVTVKFARQETEVAKKAREKSFETLTQKMNAEPWYNCQWKQFGSDDADVSVFSLLLLELILVPWYFGNNILEGNKNNIGNIVMMAKHMVLKTVTLSSAIFSALDCS